MKVLPLLIVWIAAATGCANHLQTAVPAPRAESTPPGCSPMHGGMPETANQAPIWRAGARLATSQAESAFVIIHVVRALDTLSLSDASIAFATAGTPMRAVRTDESGRAAVHLKAGRLSLTVAHMGNKRYIDTVTVRGGFADTLRIGLGTERICFM